MMKELLKLFITANILVFGLLVSYKFYGYMSYVVEPRYKIRTVDGVYYSSKFKHYGNSVTFLQDGQMVTKSQKDLHGTIIERVK